MNFKLAFPCTCILMIVFGCNRQVSKTETTLPEESREWIFEEVICAFKETEDFDHSRKYWVLNSAGTTHRSGSFLKASFFIQGYADSLLLINSNEVDKCTWTIDIRERCGVHGIAWNDTRLLTDEFYVENDYMSFSYPVKLNESQYVLYLKVSLHIPDGINMYRILVEKKEDEVVIFWDKM